MITYIHITQKCIYDYVHTYEMHFCVMKCIYGMHFGVIIMCIRMSMYIRSMIMYICIRVVMNKRTQLLWIRTYDYVLTQHATNELIFILC